MHAAQMPRRTHCLRASPTLGLLRTLLLRCVAGLALVVGGSAACPAQAESPQCVVLLVPGMTPILDLPTRIWGAPVLPEQNTPDDAPPPHIRWSGLIGRLEQEGLHFGGTITPRGASLELPAALDARHAAAQPAQANVFALAFSDAADVDGLAYKALELSEAIRCLCRFTGAQRVTLVAHSAGGLVARAYLQGALPGLAFRHDVEQLITIGTPHLGSAAAADAGGLLGTRATALGHDTELVRRLNQHVPLPMDVYFASLVIRGQAADARGNGQVYRLHLDPEFADGLPILFRAGGDQAVHVLSQNLAVARTSRRYESETGRPVLFPLVRVADPSPADLLPGAAEVHSAAPRDTAVMDLVARLVLARADAYQPPAEAELEAEMLRQARACVAGLAEWAALRRHPTHEAAQIVIERLELLKTQGFERTYGFTAAVERAYGLLRRKRAHTLVEGEVVLQFDRFGRVLHAMEHVSRCVER